MHQKFSLAMLCAGLSLFVTGCGGGGSSGGNTPTVVVGGGGTSTSPSTGGASTAVFAATAMGPMIARVNFDSDGTGVFGDAGDALSSTAIDGRIGRSISGLAPAINRGTIPASATVRMEASGLDATTALYFSQMRAPAGATVISPLTALIDAAGSESNVRNALGLDSGANALRGSISLTTFNPALGLSSSDADARHNAMQLTSTTLADL